MSNQYLKLRRSAVPGKIPDTSSIDFGEIALNTYDGLAFMKKSGSMGIEIVTIGSTSGSFTGSLYGTASWAENAVTASYVLNAISASYAETASYAPAYLPLTGGTINGDVTVNGTASIEFLHVTIESASVIYSSGSNILGDSISDTQTLIGTVIISGSQQITGSVNITGSSFQWNNNTITTHETGVSPHIPYFKTNDILATSSIYQSGSGTIIINQDNATSANPEALYVWQPHPTSFNVISGKGNLNNYLQLNIQNTNQGISASSDIVATADNGNETTNYIDMGINGENYTGVIGGPNDAYLYATGSHLHIGNATPNKPLQFFVGGPNTDADRKFELNANNQHNMTGSLEIDTNLTVLGDITGSLHGTASYAITASYALNVPNTASYAVSASHALQADNAETSISSSHALEADHAQNSDYATVAGNGGVTSIIAGSGITLLPPTGLGNVTVIASGGGGVTIISGSNVTGSFLANTTWVFNHDLGVRTPIITVFDSNYNQIIPQNIELVNTASAIITFPTAEAGFAIASLGGSTGTVYSSSYSLFSTYSDTASYYIETDPVFVAKSASLATTGSNIFKGNQTITGSLIITGSNTLIGTKTITGSVFISGSKTIVGNNTVTGSMLTTGSIILVGNQTITGSLTVSSSNTITVVGPMTITGSLLVSGSTLQTGNNTLTGNTVLSGSINVSGSQNFIGNQILTGSFLVSGSTTQIGNNSLIGNTSLTGSINVSGSQTFKGNLDLTGSLIVSGSTVQIGNNTLTGNTSLTGSITISGSTTNIIIGNTDVYGAFDVSGSSNFRDSTFTVTGSTFIKGETSISGSTGITGSLNVTGDLNVVSGSSFTRWGNKLFNYGAFSDYTTQSGSANTAYAVKFNTTDLNLEIYLSGSSAIKIQNTGIYNFQWSGQLHQGAGASVVSIWIKINGNDVSGSRGDVTLASNDDALPSWNYVLPINSNDAIELYWSSTSANTTWVFSPVAVTPPRPSTASILATLTQIA